MACQIERFAQPEPVPSDVAALAVVHDVEEWDESVFGVWVPSFFLEGQDRATFFERVLDAGFDGALEE